MVIRFSIFTFNLQLRDGMQLHRHQRTYSSRARRAKACRWVGQDQTPLRVTSPDILLGEILRTKAFDANLVIVVMINFELDRDGDCFKVFKSFVDDDGDPAKWKCLSRRCLMIKVELSIPLHLHQVLCSSKHQVGLNNSSHRRRWCSVLQHYKTGSFWTLWSPGMWNLPVILCFQP